MGEPLQKDTLGRQICGSTFSSLFLGPSINKAIGQRVPVYVVQTARNGQVQAPPTVELLSAEREGHVDAADRVTPG